MILLIVKEIESLIIESALKFAEMLDVHSIFIGIIVGIAGSIFCYFKFIRGCGSDVIFFPDDTMPCSTFYIQLKGKGLIKPFSCRRPNCQYAHYSRGPRYNHRETSLMKIFLTLNQATSTIDLCIFDFTLHYLADYLITAFGRNIRVRIITDAHFDRKQNGDSNSNDQIPRLQDAGIPIKVNRSNGDDAPKMHNKFVIVDGKYLIMGSFNWTRSAVTKNDEAVIKTDLRGIVGKFSSKFDHMWRNFENRQRS